MERPSKETLIRYFSGQCTPEEQHLIKLYLAMDIDANYIEACLSEAWPMMQSDEQILTDDKDLKHFKQKFHSRKTVSEFSAEISVSSNTARVLTLRSWLKIAAVIMMLAGSAVFLWNTSQPNAEKEQQLSQAKRIEPGNDKALLTLASGKIIKLSDIAIGTTIKLQNGIRVEKKDEGNLVYHVDKMQQSETAYYNTVTTPNGGQYRVTLPDGSKAWLNAGSSLRYPLRFTSKERRVKITGEVYFEIVKLLIPKNQEQQTHVPFYVETDRQEVQVLGTHFNVNAYPESPYTVTTLTEGSVRILTAQGKSVLLTPGEQSLVGDQVLVQQADAATVLAWVNGDFIFKAEVLENVLQKVARWYDVDIDCPPELRKLHFSGMISRSQPLSTIIDMLETTKKVKVNLTGRRLIVSN